MNAARLSWLAIARLGLVQTALGSIVVLTTSTMNRVMAVELALPAMLPGALVALHYAVQIARPRWGYGSDLGGRRTPWIVAGMAVLASGGIGAALATARMATDPVSGVALAVLAFLLIGFGVGAAGTSLLALLATKVEPSRRAPAATLCWVMMIAGFVLTAGLAGRFLDPFSPARLVAVAACVSAAAFVVTLAAVWGVERNPAVRSHGPAPNRGPTPDHGPAPPFRAAFAEIWSEPEVRRFTIFVFVSMFAYSAQDLILEPFAGTVFGYTPGESTRLAGLQSAGVLLGMLLVGIGGSGLFGRPVASLRAFAVGGCAVSAVALALIAAGALVGPHWPLRATVILLGTSNGAFAVAAIGSMMSLAGNGRTSREGLRIGLWGSAQAIAFGLGGFFGALAVDAGRAFSLAPEQAYALVFAAEAGLFVIAALLSLRLRAAGSSRTDMSAPPFPSLATGGGP